MVENCRTEIRKGTAYQSWDWDKTVKQGAEFENLETKQGGPWNTGLQGGDSKWQQEVWNCQTKVENFAEFEIGKVEELDWFWIQILYSDSLSLFESLIFKLKIILRDIIKISESLKLNLKIKYNDSFILAESNWFYGKIKQSDLMVLTDSLKYIIIKYNFDEGFFELRENLNLNLTSSLFNSVKLLDTLWIKVPTGYGTFGYGVPKYGD